MLSFIDRKNMYKIVYLIRGASQLYHLSLDELIEFDFDVKKLKM